MMPVSLRLFQLISRMLPQISLNTLKRKVSFTYITLLFAVATRERSKSATLGNIAVDGEDALNYLCIRVPVVLGKNGIESIVEINLSDTEKNHLKESAEGVSKTNGLLEL